MEQTFPRTGLNDESQAQIASSTFPATDVHGEGDVQTPSIRSEVFALLKTGQSEVLSPQSPSSNGARAAALPVIDEELDGTRRLARSLRSLRNALTPISVLSVELLSLVFHFRAREDPPWPDEVAGKGGWYAITHVCRHWRRVALEDSSLWASLTTGSSDRVTVSWISEVLVRARNAPLDLVFVRGLHPDALSKLPAHAHHIRELRLRQLFKYHSRHVQEISSSEAPVLEHFELASLREECPVICLPPGTMLLFDGRAPNLRTLTLTSVSLPWSRIPFCRLTQLEITVRYPGESPSPDDLDLNHLLDLLINNPELEVLILEFPLPAMLSQVSDRQPVHLPRLSRLSLNGFTSNVANLFKWLTLPSSATVRLRCNCERLSIHPGHLILPLVSTHLENLMPAEIKAFRIVTNYSRSHVAVATSIHAPESTAYDTHVIDSHMNREAEFVLMFDRMYNIDDPTRGDVLRRACDTLPISNIEVLSIFSSESNDSMDWFELFRRCRKVTMIEARACGSTSVLRGLAPPKGPKPVPKRKRKKGKRGKAAAARSQAVDPVAAAHAATTTPFPELTTVSLRNVYLNRVVSGPDVLNDVVVDVLRRRKANGSPLKMLHVVRCAITTERANGLEEYVEEFHWDKDEIEGFQNFEPWGD